MNETPLPLIVCATSTFGASPAGAEVARTPRRSAAWSCPSHVSTCQPNARSFASRSPSARISSVGLSDWSSLRSTTTQRLPSRSCAAGLQRLPVLSFLQLAVAGHHDDAAAAAEEALCPGHPPALGDAHAERARVRLDARARRRPDARRARPAGAGAAAAPSGSTPSACSAAYRPGTSWPLDEKKTSRSGSSKPSSATFSSSHRAGARRCRAR